MFLATLLMVQTLSPPERFDASDDRYSPKTQSALMQWIACIGTGMHQRREQANFTTEDADAVKARCQLEYDSFVENVVADLEPSTDAVTARQIAYSFMDSFDLRAIFTPEAPLQLTKLPVSRMVGSWRSGNGPLAIHMSVRFSADGDLVGTISSEFAEAADGLQSWMVISDGTESAELHATFVGGRVAVYERIPSFPGEMNFIRVSDPIIQRFDLTVEDNRLFLSYVRNDGGVTLRFGRQLESAGMSNNE